MKTFPCFVLQVDLGHIFSTFKAFYLMIFMIFFSKNCGVWLTAERRHYFLSRFQKFVLIFSAQVRLTQFVTPPGGDIPDCLVFFGLIDSKNLTRSQKTFEYHHWDMKIYWIFPDTLRNSTTATTIMIILQPLTSRFQRENPFCYSDIFLLVSCKDIIILKPQNQTKSFLHDESLAKWTVYMTKVILLPSKMNLLDYGFEQGYL